MLAHELTHVVQQNGTALQQQQLIQGNWLTDTASSVGNFIGDTASKVGNAVKDTASKVGNAVGDFLDIRDNEAALDAWEDYQDAEREKQKFMAQSHTTNNFQSTTRLGMFDVVYEPATGALNIICKCKFKFTDGTATEYPDATPEQLTWGDKEKEQWQQNFLSQCSNSWSKHHIFHCQKDWWESLTATVNASFTVVDSGEHFALDITKIPTGAFRRSGVYSPQKGLFGNYTPGRGEFDSNDLTSVPKDGGNQIPAVHEAGHMLGLDDEYETGETDAPSHSPLVQSEFGHGVARGSDGRIMSGGMDIQPEHGVTFLEALKAATGMSEWSVTPKAPKPIPPDPSLLNKGDFPSPKSDTQFA